MKNMKKICILLILELICLLFSAAINQNTIQSKITIIDNIKDWKHPVKKVFEKNDMDLLKVELLNNKKYPVFYPDYMSSYKYDFNFLNEVAKANSYNNYKIVYEYADIKSVEVFCDHKNKKLIKTIIHNDDKTQDSINEYIYRFNTKNNLGDKDFELYYKKYRITKDIDTDKFISKFGYGDANDNNNMGHIGKGPDGYERNAFGYEDGKDYIRLIMLNINDEDGGLERIDIDKTYRNIRCGDSKEKLVKVYGQPNFLIKYNENKESEYVYKYSGQELRFSIYQSHIVNISLQFNNLYKF